MAELLFLPALLGYGEAALAYAGDAWHPGRAGRLATWGVRIGWLAQTALIAALFAQGFPWDTWAGTLNLFVWLVVGGYLVWGCRARYALLGLTIMPLAAGLLLASWLAGAGSPGGSVAYSTPFLVFHVGLVLAAFAGLTLAAAMSLLYLYEERRLKRRRPASLLGRMPSLVTLDTLAARTVLVSLPALATGVGLGLMRLRESGGASMRSWQRPGDDRRLRGVSRAPPGGRLARPSRRVPRPRRFRARHRRAARAAACPLRMSSPYLIGLSHRRAPVELRERASLSEQDAAELSRRLAGDGGEAVCLSTCNRTEIYGAGDDAGALALLSETSGLTPDELAAVVYHLRDDDVALHLFRVAAGLDSLVPGEGQILGQVRSAFEQGVTGPLLDRMFRGAIHAGRKVRAQTAIGEVPASVAAAAAALAEQLFGDLTSCSVMLLGAGKTGELAAASLVARGARIELVANRSPARAQEVAERYGSASLAMADAAGRLSEADVVVASTSARGVVLARADVEPSLRARKGRPLFFIDIAVPRDVDPAVHELEGCYVYDIDDLEAVVTDSTPGRAGEAARAEAIVAAEAQRFAAWRAAREAAPLIASLRAEAEEIRVQELERARGRLERLTAAELDVVDSITARIVDKLLHAPTLRLKEAAAGRLDDDAISRRHPRQ